MPSTERRPNGRVGLETWLGPLPSMVAQGLAAVAVATWASAIRICCRMNRMSDAFRVKPWPMGAAAGVTEAAKE